MERKRGALFGAVLLVAGCGGSETSASTTSTSSGGAGGAGGTTTTTATCDACPAGSHEAAACACEAGEIKQWAVGPLLKSARDHHVSFIAKVPAGAFLFVGAGASASGLPLATVERSLIAADGTLAPFESAEKLPAGLIGPGFAMVGNGFVVAGGLEGDGNSTADTVVGAVDDQGHLTYSAGPPLTVDRYHLTLVAAKGFVFAIGGLQQAVMGGTPSQTVLDVVERATFDGQTLSAFEQVGTLPQQTTHHTAFYYNDAIWIFGGGSAAAARTDILRATLSDAGDVGTWETVGQLPEARATASADVFLDQLYIFAGMKSLVGSERDTVWRTPLLPAGVGDFADLPPLPQARAHTHQTPFYGGVFYSAGGSINHTPQKDVYVGKLE